MSEALLSVVGVDVRFGGVHALSDVTFSIADRECVALIGPNGAGKTTLLNVIAGTLAPSSGRVFLRGENLVGLTPDQVNSRGIVRTFQGGGAIRGLTVRENVMAGGVEAARIGWLSAMSGLGRGVRQARRRLEDQTIELLDLVTLSAQAHQLAATLPAGQQRLLGIARALATGAHLLIFDEPAAGLNEVEKLHLVEVIRALRQRAKTILFIEHDMDVVATLAERIIVLERGQIIADGPPKDVRNNAQVVAAYLGVARPSAFARARGGPEIADVPLLRTSHLTVGYGGAVAVDDVSIEVRAGEIVTLLGANGAGKSTLVRAVARLTPAQGGSVEFGQVDLSRLSATAAVRAGISLVPEGRELFPSLTVLDNLLVGRFSRMRQRGWLRVATYRGAADLPTARRLEAIYALFPVLYERSRQLAGTLSGGEAQMLAIGRALMAEPRLLMLDEPSLGIAPQVFFAIMEALVDLRKHGMTILLVEQNATAALQIADRGYVLANGKVAASGTAETLIADGRVLDAYLGDARVLPTSPRVRLVAS